jgi:hypothetical protein
MKQLLKVSEHFLNRSPPNLLSMQCYILLYYFYRAIGDLKKKKECIYKASKVSHIIGLANTCPKSSLQNQYERYLCYKLFAEIFWSNREYTSIMGLSLNSVDIWPDFSLNWQLIDPTQSTEDDLVVANNITFNVKFGFLVQTRVNIPFINFVENGMTNTNFLEQLVCELDNIYSNIIKELKSGPCLNTILNSINIYYLVVKFQLNIVILKITKDAQAQTDLIRLSYDIVKEASKTYSKAPFNSAALHLTLQSVTKLKDSISSKYSGKFNELILIMTNILYYSKNIKILKNKS